MAAMTSTTPIENAKNLIQRKDRIQNELDAQFSVLKTHQCTMNTPLVDEQGFPRADVDIYAVRQARVRIIELRNDLEDVTDKIKVALEVLHSDDQLPSALQSAENENPVRRDSALLKPFARVDGVMPGSPAAEAGLQREDLLLRFGHLEAESFSNASLQPLADFVSRHENRSLMVDVRRGQERISISFTPRNGWGGRGMLGCHIVPYSE